jgi:hypothetical protein
MNIFGYIIEVYSHVLVWSASDTDTERIRGIQYTCVFIEEEATVI